MRWLLYLRLVIFTAGPLLAFFWMVVILGHRRQRNFERIFFFLCLALTCFSGNSLLALNAQLYYGAPPPGLLRFAWTFLCLGLFFTPPLIVHLHAEYASLRGMLKTGHRKYLWLVIAWLPAVLLNLILWRALRLTGNFEFAQPTHLPGPAFQSWLALTTILAGPAGRFLCNVILDAIEAASRSGRVAIGFHEKAQTCTVSVEDDGP